MKTLLNERSIEDEFVRITLLPNKWEKISYAKEILNKLEAENDKIQKGLEVCESKLKEIEEKKEKVLIDFQEWNERIVDSPRFKELSNKGKKYICTAILQSAIRKIIPIESKNRNSEINFNNLLYKLSAVFWYRELKCLPETNDIDNFKPHGYSKSIDFDGLKLKFPVCDRKLYRFIKSESKKEAPYIKKIKRGVYCIKNNCESKIKEALNY